MNNKETETSEGTLISGKQIVLFTEIAQAFDGYIEEADIFLCKLTGRHFDRTSKRDSDIVSIIVHQDNVFVMPKNVSTEVIKSGLNGLLRINAWEKTALAFESVNRIYFTPDGFGIYKKAVTQEDIDNGKYPCLRSLH